MCCFCAGLLVPTADDASRAGRIPYTQVSRREALVTNGTLDLGDNLRNLFLVQGLSLGSQGGNLRIQRGQGRTSLGCGDMPILFVAS